MKKAKRWGACAATTLLAVLPKANAGNHTWTQLGTGGLWSTSTWTSAPPTEASDTLVQFFAGTSGGTNTVSAGFNSTNDIKDAGVNNTSFDLQTLTLNGTASTTAKTITINSSPAITLNFLGTSNAINNNAAGLLKYTITSNIAFTNGLTLGGSNSSLDNTISLSNTTSGAGGLSKTGNSVYTLNNVTVSSGGINISGNGRFQMNGAINVTGGITMGGGGRLIFGNNWTTNLSTLTLNSGIITYTNTSGGTRSVNAPIVFGGNVQLIDSVNIQGGATLGLGGTVNLGAATRTLTIDNTSNGVSASTTNTTSMTNVVSGDSGVGIIKGGPGILLLSASNTYSGTTTVRYGTLMIGANTAEGVNGPLGNSTSAVELSDATSNVANTLRVLTNGTYTVARDFVVNGYNANVLTAIGSNITTGTSIYSGDITLGTSNTARGVSLVARTGGTVRFTGTIKDTPGITGLGGLITISGDSVAGGYTATTGAPSTSGTVQITGNNTFTGGVALAGGATLDLDNTAQSVAFLTNAITLPTITAVGSGYTGQPTITISGGDGSGASAVPNRSSNTVVSLSLTNLGSGYRSAPMITVTGGSGSGATIQGNFITSNLTLGSGTLTIAGTNASPQYFNGIISGTNGNVVKNGTGSQTLTAPSTYTGTTTINGGTLALADAGAITGTSLITVGSAGTLDVSEMDSTFTLGASQTLAGSGSVIGTMIVGGTLSPGNSPGTLSTGSQTWTDGADYLFEVDQVTTASVSQVSLAGSDPGADLLDIEGTLDLSGLSAEGFTINVAGLAHATHLAGAVTNWNDTLNYTWTLATASEGITGFNAGDFAINTAGFTSNNLAAGTWSVSQSANTLQLNYVAIPEPGSISLIGISAAGLLARRRRR